MLAASIGEAVACLVRVPTEVVKAKMQTSSTGHSVQETILLVLKERHGGSPLSNITGGLYRGYGITLFREIPFAMIQFPLYEKFKLWLPKYLSRNNNKDETIQCTPLQAAACGSGSGAIAAAVTTPLDVIKTRLMLGTDQHGKPYKGAIDVINRTIHTDGPWALWKGIQPRVFWITLGGFVFFGAYEESKRIIQRLNPSSTRHHD